jgi:hypothetical protein
VNRPQVLKLLWTCVRRLPSGEDVLRTAVCDINDRDKTNQDRKGSSEYFSTKLLSDGQLLRLTDRMKKASQLEPNQQQRRRPPNTSKNVTYLASPSEREWIDTLFKALGFADDKRTAFITRQAGASSVSTHDEATAVIHPLERMARARGWRIVKEGQRKCLLPAPQGETTP